MWYYHSSVLLMCICLKMMKSLLRACVCAHECLRIRACECVCCSPIWIPGRTRAQASLLQFTSITSYNPISHSIDPQNCCSPEPAANTGISPHHFTTIVLYYTKKPPFVSEQTQPTEIWIINVWLIKEKGGKEREKGRELEIERSGW